MQHNSNIIARVQNIVKSFGDVVAVSDSSFTIEKGLTPGDSIMAKIMTAKEASEYLKLPEITICKYAARGKIPAIRIG